MTINARPPPCSDGVPVNEQVGTEMRSAGNGRTFIATAAVLMAGLVIVTMLAINIRLQSVLLPPPSSREPKVKVASPTAPVLQNTASPLVDLPPATPGTGPVLAEAPEAPAPALVSSPATPQRTTTLAKTPVRVSPAQVPLRSVPAVG